MKEFFTTIRVLCWMTAFGILAHVLTVSSPEFWLLTFLFTTAELSTAWT